MGDNESPLRKTLEEHYPLFPISEFSGGSEIDNFELSHVSRKPGIVSDIQPYFVEKIIDRSLKRGGFNPSEEGDGFYVKNGELYFLNKTHLPRSTLVTFKRIGRSESCYI